MDVQHLGWLTIMHYVIVLRLFGKYPAMDNVGHSPLLPECHGSERLRNYFRLVQEFLGRHNEKRQYMVWIEHPAIVYSILKWF